MNEMHAFFIRNSLWVSGKFQTMSNEVTGWPHRESYPIFLSQEVHVNLCIQNELKQYVFLYSSMSHNYPFSINEKIA